MTAVLKSATSPEPIGAKAVSPTVISFQEVSKSFTVKGLPSKPPTASMSTSNRDRW